MQTNLSSGTILAQPDGAPTSLLYAEIQRSCETRRAFGLRLRLVGDLRRGPRGPRATQWLVRDEGGERPFSGPPTLAELCHGLARLFEPGELADFAPEAEVLRPLLHLPREAARALFDRLREQPTTSRTALQRATAAVRRLGPDASVEDQVAAALLGLAPGGAAPYRRAARREEAVGPKGPSPMGPWGAPEVAPQPPEAPPADPIEPLSSEWIEAQGTGEDPLSRLLPIEQEAEALLAQGAVLRKQAERLLSRWRDGEAMSVQHQHRVMDEALAVEARCEELIREFASGAELAKEEYARKEALVAEQARAQAQTEEHLLVLGQDRRQLVVFGELLEGRSDGLPVALNASGGEVVTILGNQNSGKSVTGTALAEGMVQALPGLSRVSAPAGACFFCYDEGGADPEVLTSLSANQDPEQAERLWARYRALPQGLPRMVVLALPERVVELRRRYPRKDHPDLLLLPLKCSLGELGLDGLRLLMGAGEDNGALYLRQMGQLLREKGPDMAALSRGVLGLDRRVRGLLEARLSLVREIVDERCQLGRVLRPGTVLVVDLGGAGVSRRDVMPLFAALLGLLLRAKGPAGEDFHKVFVFDEAHRYMGQDEVGGQLARVAREIRHLLATLIVMSQDPASVPVELVSLSTVLLVHRLTSPEWWRRLQRQSAALRGVTLQQVAGLQQGEALVAAQQAQGALLSSGAYRMQVRPLCAQPGGGTRLSR